MKVMAYAFFAAAIVGAILTDSNGPLVCVICGNIWLAAAELRNAIRKDVG